MMKWKARTETINIGVMELDNFTFNEDYLEVSIDICDMSEEMKAEVNKAIEIAKVEYTIDRENVNKNHGTHWGTVWSNEPVIMDFTFLHVVLEVGKPIDYQMYIGFHDAIDDNMEQCGCSITVDLSEHTNELKKAIIKVLLDRFF